MIFYRFQTFLRMFKKQNKNKNNAKVFCIIKGKLFPIDTIFPLLLELKELNLTSSITIVSYSNEISKLSLKGTLDNEKFLRYSLLPVSTSRSGKR